MENSSGSDSEESVHVDMFERRTSFSCSRRPGRAVGASAVPAYTYEEMKVIFMTFMQVRPAAVNGAAFLKILRQKLPNRTASGLQSCVSKKLKKMVPALIKDVYGPGGSSLTTAERYFLREYMRDVPGFRLPEPSREQNLPWSGDSASRRASHRDVLQARRRSALPLPPQPLPLPAPQQYPQLDVQVLGRRDSDRISSYSSIELETTSTTSPPTPSSGFRPAVTSSPAGQAAPGAPPAPHIMTAFVDAVKFLAQASGMELPAVPSSGLSSEDVSRISLQFVKQVASTSAGGGGRSSDDSAYGSAAAPSMMTEQEDAGADGDRSLENALLALQQSSCESEYQEYPLRARLVTITAVEVREASEATAGWGFKAREEADGSLILDHRATTGTFLDAVPSQGIKEQLEGRSEGGCLPMTIDSISRRPRYHPANLSTPDGAHMPVLVKRGRQHQGGQQ